jgi:hypothetical protein
MLVELDERLSLSRPNNAHQHGEQKGDGEGQQVNEN